MSYPYFPSDEERQRGWRELATTVGGKERRRPLDRIGDARNRRPV
jgi:hypothetical protein